MNKPQFVSRTLRVGRCAAVIYAMIVAGSGRIPARARADTVAQQSQEAQQPQQQEQQTVHRELAPEARAFMSQLAVLPNGIVYQVAPSVVDPEIKRFDKSNYALFDHDVKRDARLLVFFPGTGGEPKSSWPFLETGAKAGYRVIGLMYDNGVSVPTVCGPQADPTCSDRFREKRIFGDGASSDIDDLPGESVVNRLVKFLQYLDAQHPGEGWGGYLVNGRPNWARVVVSGHSQGGGVAAYIAKKQKVARVVVLSGAWDRVEATKQWAPWVTSASATPLDRWYAAYHQKESRADAMTSAYAVIGIPADHIRMLTLEPNPENKIPAGADAYHVSMSATGVTPLDANGQPAYASDWAFLLGSGR
jgi:pimeloyl-ACP methyl ester carboxylesterase